MEETEIKKGFNKGCGGRKQSLKKEGRRKCNNKKMVQGR